MEEQREVDILSMASDKTAASFDAVTNKLSSLTAKDDVKETNGAKDGTAKDAAESKPVESSDAPGETGGDEFLLFSLDLELTIDHCYLVVSDLRESTYDVTVTLADQQANPNSPLYSVKAFEDLGLHENLLKGIYGMKYQKPSKIQERALPLLLQNP